MVQKYTISEQYLFDDIVCNNNSKINTNINTHEYLFDDIAHNNFTKREIFNDI